VVEARDRNAHHDSVRHWSRAGHAATAAERAGLNVGYPSQIENNTASPSLPGLAAIGDALDVPIAWFFLGDVPPPRLVPHDAEVIGDEEGHILMVTLQSRS